MINGSFIAGSSGEWSIVRIAAVRGAPLSIATHLSRIEGDLAPAAAGSAWCLRGVRSNDRYATRTEKIALASGSPDLGRVEATCAALIPIKKSDAWWVLAQDERRAIFEEQSRHIAIGADYPMVARRLYHSRDLGEPWDFLTWFELPPSALGQFDTLLRRLRETQEWSYVEHEVEVRLTRA